MKLRTSCAMAVLACMCYDLSYAGAVKGIFAKNKDAQQIETENTERPSLETTESSKNEQDTKVQNETESKEKVEAVKTDSAPVEKEKIVGDPIVLKINGKKTFKRSEILDMMKAVPMQMVQGIAPDKLFEMLKTQAMISYLVEEQAKKAGMDKTKEYLDQLEKVKGRLLFEMFVAKEIMPKTQSEANLKARYQKYLVEFKSGDEVKVSCIMTDNEKEAKEVLDALSKGTTFDKLMKDKKGSEAVEKYLPLNMFQPDVASKIPSEKGKIGTEYAKLGDKFVVFRLDDKRAMKPLAFEEARQMLQQIIMREEMDNMVSRLARQFKIENFNEAGKPIPLSLPTSEKAKAALAK